MVEDTVDAELVKTEESEPDVCWLDTDAVSVEKVSVEELVDPIMG